MPYGGAALQRRGEGILNKACAAFIHGSCGGKEV